MQQGRTPKTIHLDAVGGIAGDMFVAAVVDALPWLGDRVLADAAAVLPPGSGRPAFHEGRSGAIRARRFGLESAAPPADVRHDHGVDDGTFVALSKRISDSGLEPETAGHAIAILKVLAEAEAKIHDVPLPEVHFHEIADWDSLMDVVAAGSVVAALGAAGWTVSALPRGSGVVRTRHGLLPVPAPATAEILTGFAWRDDGIGGERVTPTGAAILRHIGARPAAIGPAGRLAASGFGAGTRELQGTPNVLRALVFDTAAEADSDQVAIISFEVDDMTGEEIGIAAERLRALPGLLDLSIGTRLGKKSRPMQAFRLLAEPAAAGMIAERCFLETSTIGLRLREERRMVLRREHATVGGMRLKTVTRPDGAPTAKAESDDLSGDSLAARRETKFKLERGKDG
ncbi:MAG TPA: LarC family nickel insertion protein [Dongiaceae bacterium]|nr:LarC family nickel insertion protein [Dongiaceae bacterium]